MADVDIVMRFGGESGEGVISCGEIFTLAAARAGREVYTFRTYPAEIRGGHAVYQVRVGDELLLSQGDQLDVLVAFNREAYDKALPDLKPGGVLVYDSDDFSPDTSFDGVAYPVPMTSLARDQAGSLRSKNIVVLGAVAELFDVPRDVMVGLIEQRFARKGEDALDANRRALEIGAGYVRDRLTKKDPFRVGQGTQTGRMVLSGNEAIALGSLAAGLSFFAGYPITPASDIMEGLARRLPKVGGTLVQAEDEMAALGMVLGASFGGAKAMTATSGPGLSLMVELLGLASMVELPAVVVDVQRAGPSTGMPTKEEQGDLNIAVWGAHGEAPRIVLGATSVADAFYTIGKAFDLAERYQCPVVVLSDQYLGFRKASIDLPDVDRIAASERLVAKQNGSYRRYALTDSGVSPTAIPGMEGLQHVITGLEHDEQGRPVYDPASRNRMMAKRARKMALVAQEPGMTRRHGHEHPVLGVLGWGSQEGVIREAVARANREGYRVAALHTRMVWPLPEAEIEAFLEQVDRVLIPEVNLSGQFANLIRSRFDVKPYRLNKTDGLPFRPADIYEKIREVYPDGR
ncbi:2-oxoacid:acceptor oxidoreductase subunit alpha [Limnochorda pilosa]|uniref:Pyruvate ferredoxin oxidoreductase n=1 Tax=Limnochorda pilosa TaxID=1555112 RepID=A0A0K2SQR3_LIMPI|nr:2-oxoacid:acceptor oxidoreductase subunit alpha [Limnochorda pilosa]BAS29347.1 pyruvate ferredoxin oxidoreductase [Limnochorda pilosa]